MLHPLDASDERLATVERGKYNAERSGQFEELGVVELFKVVWDIDDVGSIDMSTAWPGLPRDQPFPLSACKISRTFCASATATGRKSSPDA